MSSVPTGSIWAMGRNHRGQLGLGAEDRDEHPTAMQLAGSGGVVQVAAGMYFSAALTASGEVFLWGWNQFGQVGDGTMDDRPAPTRVTALGTDTVRSTQVQMRCQQGQFDDGEQLCQDCPRGAGSCFMFQPIAQ